MDLPTVIKPTILEIAIIPVTILLSYVAHEMLHLIAYFLFKVDFDIEIAPRRKENGLLYCLTWGQAVSITSIQPVPRWFRATQAMMPLLLFIPALFMWTIVLSKPVVSFGILANVFLFAVIALPSPIDWMVLFESINKTEKGEPT